MANQEDIDLILKLRGLDQQVQQDLAQLAQRDQIKAGGTTAKPFSVTELFLDVVVVSALVLGADYLEIKPLVLLQQQIDRLKVQPSPAPTLEPEGLFL